MRSPACLPMIFAFLAFMVGCATAPHVAAPQVPAALRPPAGEIVYLEARATGVQIYECAQNADLSYQWVFKAPEASLATPSGQALGKHYAGPTWEALDGSTVVGVVKARDAGPDNSAIPWLLLAAKTTTGAGTFTATKSIQRIATIGGVAPAAACADSNFRQIARVPYKATYYFYR